MIVAPGRLHAGVLAAGVVLCVLLLVAYRTSPPQSLVTSQREYAQVQQTPSSVLSPKALEIDEDLSRPPKHAAPHVRGDFLLLEERWRSLDAFIDLSHRHDPLFLANNWLPFKDIRPNGIAMSGVDKAAFLWEVLAAEHGHRWRTICEVGLNAGHSAVLWLEAQPNATVFIWDLGDNPYSAAAVQYLEYVYGDRLAIWIGPAQDNLVKVQNAHPRIGCDVVAIDGAKDYSLRLLDIRAFARMSYAHTVFLLDDADPKSLGLSRTEALALGVPYTEVDELYGDLVAAGVLEVFASKPSPKVLHPKLNPLIGHGSIAARLSAAFLANPGMLVVRRTPVVTDAGG
jgi:hypothetical protein